MAKRRKDDDYQEPEYQEPEQEPAEFDEQAPPAEPSATAEQDNLPHPVDKAPGEFEGLVEGVDIAPTSGGPQVYRVEQAGGVRGTTYQKGDTVVLTPEQAQRAALGGAQLSWNKDDQDPDAQVQPEQVPAEGTYPEAHEQPSSNPPAAAPTAKGPMYRR